jgi:hypothetical protein
MRRTAIDRSLSKHQENQIRSAARMYEIRDALRDRVGRHQYAAIVTDWKTVLDQYMQTNEVGALDALLEMGQLPEVNGMTLMWLTAAALEVIERGEGQ